jgi:replication factor C subunit 2/4
VLALARALLGENYKEGVLELNASDERSVPSFPSTILPD